MKLAFFSIALLSFILPMQSVKAEPSSCQISAITIKEKEAVDILQEMYLVQSDLKTAQDTLDELNDQMAQSVNRRNVDEVAQYNNLVKDYNSFVKYNNETVKYYNELKDSYNNIINHISPSTNLAFITCLNSEGLSITTNTTRLNIESLNLRMENLRNNINKSREYLQEF